jgi:LemA protein
MIWVVLLGVVLVAFWVVSVYNFFVSAKARIKAAIQEIGNQLKRQADLIPNLEESAKGYLKHEKKIYADLTEARKAISAAVKSQDPQKMADAGSKLAAVLPNIQVVVESNPELKASEVVSKLMDELRDTADKLMYARRLVIDLTADYNVKRATFPSNIIAGMFNMEEMKGMIMGEAEESESRKVKESDTKTPKVDLE